MATIYRENKNLIDKNINQPNFEIKDGGRKKATFCSLFVNLLAFLMILYSVLLQKGNP